MEELNGTAVGSNQPFDLVLVLNFAQELSMLTSQVIEPERCTDVFLPGMIAHNEDGMLEDLSTIYRVHMRTFDPETGDTVDDFNGITYPARLPGWGPGYNAHICWTSNMLYPSVPASADGNGATTIFVSRDMARASSVDDAIKRCTPDTLIAGQNQNFGDLRTGYMVTVETAPEGEYNVFNLTKSEGRAEFHANEYLRLKNISQIQKKIVSSQHRRAVFQKKSSEIKDADTMLKFLGDSSDAQYPVYRHNDTTSEFTLLTVFIDMSKKQFSSIITSKKSAESTKVGQKIIINNHSQKSSLCMLILYNLNNNNNNNNNASCHERCVRHKSVLSHVRVFVFFGQKLRILHKGYFSPPNKFQLKLT